MSYDANTGLQKLTAQGGRKGINPETSQKNGVLKDNELAKNIIQWFMLNELIKNKKNNNKEKRISLIAKKIIPLCIYVGINLDNCIIEMILVYMVYEDISIEEFEEIYLDLSKKINRLKSNNNNIN